MSVDQLDYTRRFIAGLEKDTVDVYAMFAHEDDGPRYVKIGYSKRAGIRRQGVQNGCPVPIRKIIAFQCESAAHAKEAEKAIHGALADQRTVCEWFRADNTELVMAVFELAAANHGCKGIAEVDPVADARRERKRRKLRIEYAFRSTR